MTIERVSVIVPSYQSALAMESLLEGLFRQRLPKGWEMEVIVVDGNAQGHSPDGTADIVRNRPARLLRAEHTGPGANRNQGAREAQGTLFVFLDSDCIPLENDFLERHIRAHEDRNTKRLVCGPRTYGTKDRNAISDLDQACNAEGVHWKDVAHNPTYFYSANFSCWKVAFRAIGPFDNSVCPSEDMDWSWRAQRLGHFVEHCPEAMVAHLPNHRWKSLCRHSYRKSYFATMVFDRNYQVLRSISKMRALMRLTMFVLDRFLFNVPAKSAIFWRLRKHVSGNGVATVLLMPVVWLQVVLTYLGVWMGGLRYLSQKGSSVRKGSV